MSRPASSSPWAGEPPQRAAARERLVAAARRCIARDGVRGAGVAAVALEAGVSRPTVYRYFADRDALVAAALLDAGRDFSRAIAERVARFETPGEQALEAVVAILERLPADPVLAGVWRPEAIDTVGARGFTAPLGIEMARAAFEPIVARAGFAAAEAEEVAETVMRFVVSFLAAPEPRRDGDALRGYLRRRLLPALGLSGR